MNEEDRQRSAIRLRLIQTIEKMGYPPEFGAVIADQLGTEKTMSRMIGYLREARPRSAEEIADEMLAICSDRDQWINKKNVSLP